MPNFMFQGSQTPVPPSVTLCWRPLYAVLIDFVIIQFSSDLRAKTGSCITKDSQEKCHYYPTRCYPGLTLGQCSHYNHFGPCSLEGPVSFHFYRITELLITPAFQSWNSAFACTPQELASECITHMVHKSKVWFALVKRRLKNLRMHLETSQILEPLKNSDRRASQAPFLLWTPQICCWGEVDL